MSDANREQAERCAEMGLAAQRAGDLDKALRLMDKALRMCDLPAIRRARDRVVAAMEAAAGGGGGGDDGGGDGHGPATTPSASPPTPSSSSSRAAANGYTAGGGGGGGGGGGAAGSSRSAAAGAAGVSASARARTSSGGGAPVRPHTAEQAEAVAAVKRAKDYYEVRGEEVECMACVACRRGAVWSDCVASHRHAGVRGAGSWCRTRCRGGGGQEGISQSGGAPAP